MPTPRKLHTRLAELEGRQAAVSPTVAAAELARDGDRPTSIDGISPAEYALKTKYEELDPRDRSGFERDAWWAQTRRDPGSPYHLRNLTNEERGLADGIAAAFDRECFVAPIGASISQHHDARIVAEALATSAELLLTSNIRSIKEAAINDWAERWADEFGLTPQRVVSDTDATLLAWTEDPEREDRLLRAALTACRPDKDDASRGAIIRTAAPALKAMGGKGGGRLPGTATKLAERLQTRANPDDPVSRTRHNLPSPTIETDGNHPAHPSGQAAGGAGWNRHRPTRRAGDNRSGNQNPPCDNTQSGPDTSCE